MRDRLKLPLTFDAERLREDLLRIEQCEWIDHFVKQNYEGTWSVIPLRGPSGAEHPVMMIYSDPTCKKFSDTPFLKQCPYFQVVLASFPCNLDAVRLMKLAPGSMIKEHTDYDLSFEYGQMRLHVPVATNPDVEFCLNGERVIMREGECWYLRLCDPHYVVNHGQTDRIHMVIDARINDWTQKILDTAVQLAPIRH